MNRDYPCNVGGCAKAAHARGWCRMHYMRWWEHGDVNFVAKHQPEKGAVSAFVERAIACTEQCCLIWPFSRNNKGYAQVRNKSVSRLVTRLVCEAINGAPDFPDAEAAHSCGNGHLGCVNGSHLRWATGSENSQDMIAHGRALRGQKSPNNKLTPEQVKAIYRRVNNGETQRPLAVEYGVAQTLISRIKRRLIWSWLLSEAA